MKTLLEYIDVVVEETSPINIILAVAELMRKEADASRETAKTSIFVFLDKLNNAGLSIDYPGLKAYYDADPRLSNVIQQFKVPSCLQVQTTYSFKIKNANKTN